MTVFPALPTDTIAELVQRVQRSVVILHNGRHGVGAGIIWQNDGLILTNNHVAGRGRIRVTLPDGAEVPAQRVASDLEIDLALLRVATNGLPTALVADSRNLSVGNLVLAVGHPWGQRGAVTVGLISGLGTAKTDGKRGAVDVIRTDVRLAPGNSGGPLVNAVGAVVGINTMIVGGDLSVAIPSHIANAFVAEVLGKENVNKQTQKARAARAGRERFV